MSASKVIFASCLSLILFASTSFEAKAEPTIISESFTKKNGVSVTEIVSSENGVTTKETITDDNGVVTKVIVPVTSESDLVSKAIEDIQDTTQIKTYGTVSDDKSADEKINERIEAFLNENNLKAGIEANKNDKSIYYNAEFVSVNRNHADFERYKYIAYREAYQGALAEYVKSIVQSVASEMKEKTESDYTSGNNLFPEPLKSGSSAFGSIVDKTIALTGSKLDEALENMGIDPNQYNATPKDQKRVLLTNKLIDRSTVEASRSFGGLSIVQTFLEFDKADNAAVGVVVMYSPHMEAIAQSLQAGQKPAFPHTGKSVAEQYPLHDPKALYYILGSRIMVDANGPVILAFGQWANSYTGSNRQLKAERRKHAEHQANMNATRDISEFLGLSFSTKEESETGKMKESAKVKSGVDGMINDVNANALIDTALKQAQTKSSNFLQGLSTIKKWYYTTPQGHDVVGVVKMYNFNAIDKINNMNKPKVEDIPQTTARSGQGSVIPDLDIF